MKSSNKHLLNKSYMPGTVKYYGHGEGQSRPCLWLHNLQFQSDRYRTFKGLKSRRVGLAWTFLRGVLSTKETKVRKRGSWKGLFG